MGQSQTKQATGQQLIRSISEKCYDKFFVQKPEGAAKKAKTTKEEKAELYNAICRTVEEINHQLGNTQVSVPKKEILEEEFENNKSGENLKKDEFQRIVEKILPDIKFTGIGAKDSLLYIFGVPVATLFLKQSVMPDAVPNEYLIPGVTSLTTMVLAALNKI